MVQCNKRPMNQARCSKGVRKRNVEKELIGCRSGAERNVMSSRAVHIVATNTGVGECERAESNQIDVR
jgi:hypothetical protein